MGFWSEVITTWKQEWNKTNGTPQMAPGETRELNDNDLLDWDDALTRRANPTKREIRTMDQARHALKLRNPVRYAQLNRDFKWAQKQMVKLGLNPDDLRYVL